MEINSTRCNWNQGDSIPKIEWQRITKSAGRKHISQLQGKSAEASRNTRDSNTNPNRLTKTVVLHYPKDVVKFKKESPAKQLQQIKEWYEDTSLSASSRSQSQPHITWLRKSFGLPYAKSAKISKELIPYRDGDSAKAFIKKTISSVNLTHFTWAFLVTSNSY